LYYWLQLYKKEFERQAVGSTIKTIGLPYFKKLRISFPKYPEQVRIAEIIGTWDCAIDTVGKLIDNSEHLHRALVKRLFTSAQKTRNAKEYLVGDLGIIFTGLSGKRGDDFGRGNPYVPYSNVFKNSRFDPGKVDYVLLAPGERQNQVRYGDTLVTTSSETPDEVGMTSVVLDEVKELYLNSFCFGFRPNDFAVILPEYGRYLFRSPEFRRLIIPLAQGSTRYNLAKSEFLKLRVVLPPVDEQAKIAVILSESESLSTKLRDYVRTLTIERSALMQQLLTGKCRVQLDEAKGKAAVA
jgi:type I restriction enzyme S subunit